MMTRKPLLLFFPFIAVLSLCLGSCAEDDRTQIGVLVKPLCVRLDLGQSQDFCATVTNTDNQRATWEILNSDNSGSLSNTQTMNTELVTYTAPAVMPNSCVVTIRASSQEKAGRIGQASVILGADCSIDDDAKCVQGPIPVNCSSF